MVPRDVRAKRAKRASGQARATENTPKDRFRRLTPRPKGSTVTITVGRFEPADPEPTATATPSPTVVP